MVTQMTRQARRVVRRAWAEAERLHIKFFGGDSLLLGLLCERTCPATRLLQEQGLDPRRARQDLEALVRAPAQRAADGARALDLAGAWKQAFAEAHGRDHDCLGTAHLLLAVLHESESAAARVLLGQGLSLDAVRQAAGAAAGGPAEGEGGALPLHQTKSAAECLRELQAADPGRRARAALGLTAGVASGQVEVEAATAVPLLVRLLRDPESPVRAAAAVALARFGPAARPAVPALCEALRDREDVRTQAAAALAEIGVDAAVAGERLVPLLEDPAPAVRVAAAAAVGGATGRPDLVLPVLRAGLRADNTLVRGSAARALGKLGPAAAPVVDSLIAALADADEFVRFSAATALKDFGGAARPAVPALLAALRRGTPLTRIFAGAALAAIARAAPDVLPDLLAALHDPEPEVRGGAAQALAAVTPRPEALPELLALVGDPRPETRGCAAGLLGRLGPAGAPALPSLRAALDDPAGSVRVRAARALWALGERAGVLPSLAAALASPDREVAVAAAATLAGFGPDAAEAGPALREALERGDPYLQVAAGRALWHVEGRADEALTRLAAALAGADRFPRRLAAHALGEVGPAAAAAVPALRAAWEAGDRFDRAAVEHALARIAPDVCLRADEPVIAYDPGAAPAEPSPGGAEADDWTEALRLDPDDAQAYRCRAGERFRQDDHRGAVADCTEALRREEDATAFLTRGRAYSALGDWERAIADFTEVLRRDPDSVDAHNLRGIARKRCGDLDGALADYSEAVRLVPGSAQVRFNRSLAAKAKGDYAGAAADLEAALRLNPEYANGHNNLAWLLATCPEAAYRDGARAVAHARRACELTAWAKAIHLSALAAAHAEAGQFDEALRRVREALACPGLTAARVEEFTGHLRHYERRQPFRAAPAGAGTGGK